MATEISEDGYEDLQLPGSVSLTSVFLLGMGATRGKMEGARKGELSILGWNANGTESG